MDTFKHLREIAINKRDKAIKEAKAEYRETIREIEVLEQKLNGTLPKNCMRYSDGSMADRILEVAPTDRCWSINDLIQRLELTKTEMRNYNAVLNRMLKQGRIKRIRRGRSNKPAIWAVTGYEFPTSELNDLSQVEAAEAVLRELGEPVDLVTLIVEMLERGYQPVNGEAKMRQSLHTQMSKKRQFVEINGFWSV